MKKIILSLVFMTLAVFSYGQDGNPTVEQSTVSYGQGAGVTGAESIYFGFKTGQENSGTHNTFLGYISGRLNKGKYNVFLGGSTGKDNQGNFNVFIGYNSGFFNTEGSNNSFIGYYSGLNNKDGKSNTFLGAYSGEYNKSGESNTFLGTYSGKNNIDGTENTFIGHSAGTKNQYGNRNTFVGNSAGAHNEKDGNVFIGYNAGLEETGSDKLYIANTDTPNPLIYGDFELKHLTFNGKVGIGHVPTVDSDELTVKGKILCEEIEVIAEVTPDYVFEKYYNGFSTLKSDYKMPSLDEVEAYVKEYYHLPEVPSAAEMKENGMQLKDMTTILLQKVEELTLYTIEQEKRIKALEAKLNKQK